MEENIISTAGLEYGSDTIRTLDWKEHIRRRPGMYIGKLGDGTHADDGIYVLLKEVLDNAIDEYMMGYGKQIVIDIDEVSVTVRDHGRGIPLDKVKDVSSKMNTGAKYDSKAFKKSVGLNGVGIKAVNALSTEFYICSYRDGRCKSLLYNQGNVVTDFPEEPTSEENGTLVRFVPDETIFKGYKYKDDFIESLLKNYVYLNSGLTILFNGRRFHSKNGLVDLLNEKMTAEPLYPIIHLKGDDIEVVITHINQYGEEYYSFVNGQHTTQGGTHLTAFREAASRTIKEFYNKNFDYSDIRNGIVAAVSIKVEEPVFESQTKTKLGSRDIGPEGPSVSKFIGDFLKKELDNYLHKNAETADALLKKILESEKERKAIAGVTKLARERAKKSNLHNKKLRDCRVHYNDTKGDNVDQSSIFITEGDSATGSITKSRNVETQAVFSLRGKPLNSYGLTRKVVYENEEFNLLQAALNVEDGMDGLRYNKIIIATDADVDGFQIRTLVLTMIYRLMPTLIEKGKVYIAESPLYEITITKTKRKGEKHFAYTDGEKEEILKKFTEDGLSKERDEYDIKRSKGLGENEPDMMSLTTMHPSTRRLIRVTPENAESTSRMFDVLLGDNITDRKEYIADNGGKYMEMLDLS